jgi:hypothetical protein
MPAGHSEALVLGPALAGAAWSAGLPHGKIATLIQGASTYTFPLTPWRTFLVSLDGPHPRVEPYSRENSAEWDLLIGSGRLGILDVKQAKDLTQLKWDDGILGLAGAYAVYGQMSSTPAALAPYLNVVLGNLQGGIGHNSPDVQLLRVFLQHLDQPRFSSDARLQVLAGEDAVPLFRWGVPLAINLLDRARRKSAEQKAWRKKLETIDETLSPASAWTVWSPS